MFQRLELTWTKYATVVFLMNYHLSFIRHAKALNENRIACDAVTGDLYKHNDLVSVLRLLCPYSRILKAELLPIAQQFPLCLPTLFPRPLLTNQLDLA